MTTRSAVDLAVRGLAADSALGRVAESALRELPSSLRVFDPGQQIDTEPSKLIIVASGWSGLVRSLTDGRRQILSVLVPGDLALRRDHRATGSYRTVALSKVQATSLDDFGSHEEFATVVQSVSERNDSYIFDHVVRLGILSSYERVGHFLLETYERLSRSAS